MRAFAPIVLVVASGCGPGIDEIRDGGFVCEPACSVESTVEAVFENSRQNPLDFPALLTSGGAHFYMVPASVEFAIDQYSATGQHLRRVERRGGGPGEFIMIADLAWLPDEGLLVHDFANRRETVLDDELRELSGRQLDYPPSYRGHSRVGDADFVAVREAPENSRRVVLRLAREGAPADALLTVPDEESQWYFFSPATDSSAWVVAGETGRVREVSESGAVLLDIEPPHWFEASPRRDGVDHDDIPPPAMAARDVRRVGAELWVLSSVPDSRGPIEYRTPDEAAANVRRQYDSVIEILDPATGDRTYSFRTDRFIQQILPDGRLVSFHSDTSGEPVVEILRLAPPTTPAEADPSS